MLLTGRHHNHATGSLTGHPTRELRHSSRPRAYGSWPLILKVLLYLHGRLHSWDDLRLIHHVNHFNLLGLGFEIRADGSLKETSGVLMLRRDIECLEKRLELMNQIDILIVLIGLGDD